MPAYLLIWNPAEWEWPERASEARKVREGKPVLTDWGSGVRKKILPEGSRLFLMKKGSPPRGIIAAGWSTGSLHSRPHWGEPTRDTLYVPLRFDDLVEDPDKELLKVDELLRVIPLDVVNWNTAGGGIEIQDGALAQLEQLWAEHLRVLGYREVEADLPRERALRLVQRKVRDSRFSRQVRALSGGRCAVCPQDLNYETVGILEAAHIRAVEDDGPDLCGNGLALCPNHHALFDEGFWALEQRRLVLSPQLPDSLRQTFSGSLHCPWALIAEHVEWHYRERFRKGPLQASGGATAPPGVG